MKTTKRPVIRTVSLLKARASGLASQLPKKNHGTPWKVTVEGMAIYAYRMTHTNHPPVRYYTVEGGAVRDLGTAAYVLLGAVQLHWASDEEDYGLMQ